MRFDIVHTLEIPQGATELTTSQLEQISGGSGHHLKSNKHANHRKYRKLFKSNHTNSFRDDNN